MQALLTSPLEPSSPAAAVVSENGLAPFSGDFSGDDSRGPVKAHSTTATISDNGMEDYQRLQRRLLTATLVATSVAVPLSLLLFDPTTAASLLVGALCGLLYLRLLARSVSRLGVASKSLGKVQLLVPVVLVLAASRIPALQMLPALIGFLLYKPALIVQALLDA